jgi:hypothetical protein
VLPANVSNGGFRWILEPQVNATLYLNAMLDQERPASCPGTLCGLSMCVVL